MIDRDLSLVTGSILRGTQVWAFLLPLMKKYSSYSVWKDS